MTFTDVTSKFDDGLHALDLALDDLVKILLLDLWERQEVDGADICARLLGDERPQALVDVLSQEGSVRGLRLRSWSVKHTSR